MRRVVQPEWLDDLAPDDPRARRSRRDLRRLNRIMGHARFLAGSLAPATPEPASEALGFLDLGSGDAHVTLDALTRLPPRPHATRLWLVDRHPIVAHATLAAFRSRGWQPTVVADDVFDMLTRRGVDGGRTIGMANLFLHHFADAPLRELLGLIAARCHRFVACEPRRSALARIASRLVGVVGGNAITRHDARVSVDAGFRDGELAELWPDRRGWSIVEEPVGWFSHRFVVRRLG